MSFFMNFNLNFGYCPPSFGFSFGFAPMFNYFHNWSLFSYPVQNYTFTQYSNPTTPQPNPTYSTILNRAKPSYSWENINVGQNFDSNNWYNFNLQPTVTKKVSNKQINYSTLSRESALNKAKNSSSLEKLNGGNKWSVSDASFINDIPYAGKGINGFLDNLTTELDIDLTVTSALGTKNSPHVKVGGHYNDKNPKLDFGGGLTVTEANEIKNKLDATNYFESIRVEEHSDGTAHIDVKIKDEALRKYA